MMEAIPNIGDLVKKIIAGVSVFNRSVDIDSKVLSALTKLSFKIEYCPKGKA